MFGFTNLSRISLYVYRGKPRKKISKNDLSPSNTRIRFQSDLKKKSQKDSVNPLMVSFTFLRHTLGNASWFYLEYIYIYII